MKKNFLYLIMFLVAGFFATSCNDDDDTPPVIDNPVYGMQITGTATGDVALVLDAKQMVEPSSDFAIKAVREGMMYGIHFLSAGDFAFSQVTADGEVSYGATDMEQAYQSAEVGGDTDSISYKKGMLSVGGSETFSVAEEGLYYVLTDETTMKFWIMKIEGFEINVTGDVAEYVSGSADAATFEVKAVDLRAKFKLRINKAWKFVFEDVEWTDLASGGAAGDHCRPVISYGGTLAAMTADGEDMEVDNGGQLLDFSFAWTSGTKGIAGVVGTTELAGELPPAEFPDNMYMIGNSVGGWDWDANAVTMIPVHSNPHVFWSIVYITAGIDDPGFKFSPEKAWGKDFGVDATAGATDGVYNKGTDNVPDVAESGYYTVVVNLEAETVEVNAPMIYGIGDAFGSWDAAQEALMFTVDNTAKVITSPATTVDGNVRMHIAAATLTNDAGTAVDWWQAEFNVIDGTIEYRGTGDDQAAVASTIGQVVTLDFVAGTGTIE